MNKRSSYRDQRFSSTISRARRCGARARIHAVTKTFVRCRKLRRRKAILAVVAVHRLSDYARRRSRKPSAKRQISRVTRRCPRGTRENQGSRWQVSDSSGWRSGQAARSAVWWIRARLARILVTADPWGSSRPARHGSSHGDRSSSSGRPDDRAAPAPCGCRTHPRVSASRSSGAACAGRRVS